jgi:NADH-quinone oxidoreductase subunit J
VATPALLPDGSVAPESLSAISDSTAAARFDAERRRVADQTAKPDAHALVGGTDAGGEKEGDEL